jgi:hypothetical protein
MAIRRVYFDGTLHVLFRTFNLRATSDEWKPTGGSQKVEVMIG